MATRHCILVVAITSATFRCLQSRHQACLRLGAVYPSPVHRGFLFPMSFLGQFLFFFSPLHSVLSAKSLEGERGWKEVGKGRKKEQRPSCDHQFPQGFSLTGWLSWLAAWFAWMGSVSIFPSPFPIELALKWALNCSCSLICFILKLNNLDGKA